LDCLQDPNVSRRGGDLIDIHMLPYALCLLPSPSFRGRFFLLIIISIFVFFFPNIN